MVDVTIPALDGDLLAATLYSGDNREGPVVLVSSGTAIPRQYYARFGKWLAQRGASHVVTYDYRGIGGSWPQGERRDFEYLMSDWARLDYPAMIDYMGSQYPGRPLYTIGHSFGGQVFGLSDRNEQVEKSVLIASMFGHWRRMTFPDNYKAWFMLSVIGPMAGRYYGYIPGRFGLGEDMGLAAFKEWARWCKTRNYFFDDPAMVETRNFASYRGKMLAIGMQDDPWGTPELVDALVENFTNAQLERWEFSTAEAGGKIGHFGFFKERYKTVLWERVGAWLFG